MHFFCFSSIRSCCREIDGSVAIGDWFYPNISQVGSQAGVGILEPMSQL